MKKVIILILFILFFSCQEKKVTKFYLGQYFEKGQKVKVEIDNGNYIYQHVFKSNYVVDSPKFIKEYKVTKDDIVVHLTIDNNDTIVILPSNTEKVLLGNDIKKDLFIYTEKDVDVWLVN